MAKYITVICKVEGQTVLRLIDDFDRIEGNIVRHIEDQTHNGFDLNLVKDEPLEEEILSSRPLNHFENSCDSLEYDDYFDESKTFNYLWYDVNSGTANSDNSGHCGKSDEQSLDGYKKYLNVIKTTKRQMFGCKYKSCKYQTMWKNAIINHIRSAHLHFYPFVCGFADCGKGFAIRSNLNNHLKVHSKSSDLPFDESSHSSSDMDRNYSQNLVQKKKKIKKKSVLTQKSTQSYRTFGNKKPSFAQNIRQISKKKKFGRLESSDKQLNTKSKTEVKEVPKTPIIRRRGPKVSKRGRPSSDQTPAFVGIKSVEKYIKQTEENGKLWRSCLFPDCSYGSKYATSILYHIRNQHLDDKPYVCKLCDKSFAMRTNLKNHQKVHKTVNKSVNKTVNQSCDQ